jgi:photosystem II stability/assembly factor-like uncharacterized protein
MISKSAILGVFFLFFYNAFSFAQIVTLTNIQNSPSALDVNGNKANNIANKLADLKARNIGPSIMSGRVVDLAVNPADPTEFFVGYATGGVWHTKNNGQSFNAIFDKITTCIGAIAVNWKRKEIWIGTGEANSSRSSYAGKGVFKGTWINDTTFNFVNIGLTSSQHIANITLHPTDNNTAYVAVLGNLYTKSAARGFYKTTDGGKTWKQTLFVNENTGVVDISLHNNNPNIIYASAWYRTRSAWNFEEAGETSGIYKSKDAGETWTNISEPKSGFAFGNGVGRIGLAVAPSNQNTIYAVVDNNTRPTIKDTSTKKGIQLMDLKDISKQKFALLDSNLLDTFLKKQGLLRKYNAKGLKAKVAKNELAPTALFEFLYDANTALFDKPIIGCEVYKSEDGGVSWKKTNTKPLKLFNTYGYYFGKIFVSEANINKVVITGFGIEMSTDGGKTFARIDKGNVHPDHHSCWINPKRDNHMIIGNDGGVNITYDDGKAWFKANTPAVGQAYAIQVDNAKPYNVYAGFQDNGVWYGSSKTKENNDWQADGENPYKNIYGGDGMQIQVDTRDNETIYTGLQFGNYSRLNKKDPNNDTYITPQRKIGEPAFRFNWQTPILLSPHHKDILYFGSNKLHKSFNKGDSLPAISADLTNGGKAGDVPYGTITTISESELQPNLIFVGTDDGNIQISKDGGYTFTNINAGLPSGLWVSRVIASRHNVGTVYASLSGFRNDDFTAYLYVSTNSGSTWQKLGNNLPAEPLNVVREDLYKPNILYIGNDNGVYISTNKGDTFTNLCVELPAVPVHDLVIQPTENELVIGTHGRSIFIIKLNEVYKKLGL